MKRHILTFVLALTALAALAQYSIDWSTTDGGGGTMSGGSFTLRGTIGQPDADQMDGGDFVILGGFWVPQAVQMPGAPWLSILAEGGTNVIVSWIPADPGWVLQESDNVHSNWMDSASGSLNPVSIPATAAAQFYRLRQ